MDEINDPNGMNEMNQINGANDPNGPRQPAAGRGSGDSLQAEDRRFARALNEWAFELYEAMDGPGGAGASNAPSNRMVSPAGIAFAVSMLREGARGSTADEIDRLLHVHALGGERLGASQRRLQDALLAADPSVRFEIANSLWNRESDPPFAAFAEALRRDYDAQVGAVDFESPDAALAINDWVSKSTHGKIVQLADSAALRGLSFYLANALYLKGAWSEPFDPRLTQPFPFRTADGAEIEVPTMRRQGRFAYCEHGDAQAVRLPYGDRGAYVMTLILPAPGYSLQKHEALTPAGFALGSGSFKSTLGTVELPRFKVESGFALNRVLHRLGMRAAFDPAQADFGGISAEQGRPVGSLVHKTFIEVDEKGVEAAAVTGIARAGAAPAPEPPFELKFNRPFFFAITERTTGLIVFMGEVGSPLEY